MVSDKVTTEELAIHIGVLAALTNVVAAGVLSATVLLWFVSLAASILVSAVLLVIYLSRLREKDVIDVFLPKRMPQVTG
jgi:hypothetical protein